MRRLVYRTNSEKYTDNFWTIGLIYLTFRFFEIQLRGRQHLSLTFIVHYEAQMPSFYLKVCNAIDRPFQMLAKEIFFESPSCARGYGVNVD